MDQTLYPKKVTFIVLFSCLMYLLPQQTLCTLLPYNQKFTLLTMLYNETNEDRLQEYITCMERNLKHPSINHVHVFFDTKGNSTDNKLLEYLKSKPVSLTFITGRATFEQFWKLAHEQYPETAILISNADIYFDETLTLLERYDLSNKFIALTRWDVNKDSTESLAYAKWNPGIEQYVPLSGKSYSQDAWIFKTPIVKFDDTSMELGILHFDPRLAYQADKAGLQVINPCFSIKCHHLHLSRIRHYHWINPKYPHLNLPVSYLTDSLDIQEASQTQNSNLTVQDLPLNELYR